jgi:predicted AAA+ superfamily ATPase
MIETLLVYGSYPEVFITTNSKDKQQILEEISGSYLFKDIFELLNLRHRGKLYDLLRLLAFQVGSEVSLNELGNTLKLNRETIEKYLHLLEDTFIICKLNAFSRNLRKEISKMSKYYFYDLGIRNFLIDNLHPLHLRNDVGQLWENFIIIERIKHLSYKKESVSKYFWRTYTGAEIDYLEERSGKITGYEIKYSRSRKSAPKTFTEEYRADYYPVNRENYLEFISGK